MNIRLLGTGAADGIPGFYANNPVSQYARQHGGKDIRSRASALVDGVLQIDLPPDALGQMHRFKVDASDWSALLYTHSHEDHFCVGEIQYAMFPFTELEQLPYQIYANETVAAGIWARYPEWPIDVIETRSFLTYTHGSHRITPIRANHIPDEDCHNYIIEQGESTLLYATDTGVWDDETFEFISSYCFDCMVVECTEAFFPTSYEGHMDFKELDHVLNRLRNSGTIDSTSQIVSTHHAHTGGATHAQLEEELGKMGVKAGYDGMVIKF